MKYWIKTDEYKMWNKMVTIDWSYFFSINKKSILLPQQFLLWMLDM